MKKILITGGAGFIGGNLAVALAKLGHEVVIVDDYEYRFPGLKTNPELSHKNIRYISADFATFYGLYDMQFDVIFHLAASINVDESIVQPSDYFENNISGTARLIQAVREHQPKQCKFIYASSAEVYGTARTEKINEDHPLDPLSPYAVSKLSAEQILKVYSQLYGMDITVIRNFNTFGEYQRGDYYGGVISKFAHLAKDGKDLPVYGSGEQTRGYMHVSQAVNGYILAMEKKLPTIINFGADKAIKIIDIANYIAEEFGVKVYHEKSRPNEIMSLEADVSRAMSYGYKIETDFWQNLKSYLQFIKNN